MFCFQTKHLGSYVWRSKGLIGQITVWIQRYSEYSLGKDGQTE